MKRPLLLLAALLCLGGCASTSALDDHGGRLPTEAADGSPSPITQEQTWTVAEAELLKREHWPNSQRDAAGLIHTVAYSSRRINRGGWRVVAQKAVTEGTPDGGGGCAYDPGVPAVVMIIDRRGRVVNYSHLADTNSD